MTNSFRTMILSQRTLFTLTLCASWAPASFGFAGMQTTSIIPTRTSLLFQRPNIARLPNRSIILALSNDGSEQPSMDENEFINNADGDKELKTKSFVVKLDELGQSLKPRALKVKEKLDDTTVTSRKQRFVLALKVCVLFALFIIYRAYRGFFVILPAVFREVYRKLQTTVDSPFGEEPGAQDIDPNTGKVRLRTRATVSFLAATVTLSYVVGGALTILGKFIGTITKTSSASSSFEAAADEAMLYENKIMRMTQKGINGTADGKSTTTTGLAP